jgi:predicted esterase
MITHHSTAIRRTAHYYTLGTPGASIRQFWIVCHGYAQLADEFLKEFDLLDNEQTFVVAPDRFNLFYRKGFTGPIGANWMTRQHRESAIADYCNFIQQVYDFYMPQLPADVRIVLLGFSQGSATVTRWVMGKQPHFHDLLLWAGLPPEDIDYASQREYLSDKNLYLLYGSDDPFLTPDRMTVVQDIETKNGIDFQEELFTGGHEIPVEVLQQFLKRLN